MSNDDLEPSDDEVAALNMERDVFGVGHGAETPKMTAERLLRENVSAAAMTVINLAKGAHSENVRLNAAKAILDRVGVGKDIPLGGIDSIESFLRSVQG
jgi:hypothetical protein